MKIDVEGHEDSVVEGMRKELEEGRVEHILFEEFRSLPSPLCLTLADLGFEAFLIAADLADPTLTPVANGPAAPPGRPPNVLATRSPEQVRAQLRPRSFRSLGAR